MDIATIAGILCGTFFILSGIGLGAIGMFIDIPSIMIVVGGALASYLVSFKMDAIKNIGSVFKVIFTEKKIDSSEIISSLVSFAEKARREGLLALEEDVENLEDEFLKKGIQLVVDGTDPELVRKIMGTEINNLDERHGQGKAMLECMGAFAPAWGMIGTVIGLILMLANLEDKNSIGPAMAVALITTLYGAVMANFFFLPMAGKLGEKNNSEMTIKNIMIEGLLSIQAGDNPRIVEEKLKAFLPPKDRESLEGSESEEGE